MDSGESTRQSPGDIGVRAGHTNPTRQRGECPNGTLAGASGWSRRPAAMPESVGAPNQRCRRPVSRHAASTQAIRSPNERSKIGWGIRRRFSHCLMEQERESALTVLEPSGRAL